MKKSSFCIALLIGLLIASLTYGKQSVKKLRCVSPASVSQFIAAADSKTLPLTANSRTRSARAEGGNILIFEAGPQLLTVPSPFDLRGKTIRFQPALADSYTYSTGASSFDAQASTTLALTDDESSELRFDNFSFPFAGKTHGRCYINSNGNITFEMPDPDPPDLETLIQGPPRIAPFFADLDPENQGTVFVRNTNDTITISWLKVPEFFNNEQFEFGQNTFQVVLHRTGQIELVYSEEISATQALIGITSGNGSSALRQVDFSKGTHRNRPSGSLIENFHDYQSVDIRLLMQSIYRTVPDKFDFVTLFSNFALDPIPGVQAFAINIQNDVRGIGNPGTKGNPIFRENSQYGSSGKLQNITFLGNIHQYPEDPTQRFPGTGTSVLQILAHEVGHRWLAYISTPRDLRRASLIGRDRVHWSFFFDTDGSFLEGNQILQQSKNSFLTSRPFQRYSDLDLYLMGLIGANEVRPSFVVEGPSRFSPSFEFRPESAPESNVSFKGNALPVKIEDVVAANGVRKPDVSNSQKEFQHLFVLIVKSDQRESSQEVQFIELMRNGFEQFFSNATGGKAKIQSYID